MIDLYALPDDFPGTEAFKGEQDPYRRVEGMEQALAEDIDDPRFMPYIQLHEFEADPAGNPGKIRDILRRSCTRDRAVEAAWLPPFDSPELIDDGAAHGPVEAHCSLDSRVCRREADGRPDHCRRHRAADDPRKVSPFRRLAQTT